MHGEPQLFRITPIMTVNEVTVQFLASLFSVLNKLWSMVAKSQDTQSPMRRIRLQLTWCALTLFTENQALKQLKWMKTHFGTFKLTKRWQDHNSPPIWSLSESEEGPSGTRTLRCWYLFVETFESSQWMRVVSCVAQGSATPLPYLLIY